MKLSGYIRWIAAVILPLVMAILLASQAKSAELCERLFVPEGYGLYCETDVTGVTRVEPAEGTFAALSSLSLEPLDKTEDGGAFTDPANWLVDNAGLDLSFLQTRLEDLGNDPDNPLGSSTLDGIADVALEALAELRAASLSACGEPISKSNATDLSCEYGLGPMNYFTFNRVISIDSEYYLVSARTMNEQRLSHFKAIANSFE